MAKLKWKVEVSGGDNKPTSAKMTISHGTKRFIRTIDDIEYASDDENEILKKGLKNTFGKKKGKKIFKKIMEDLESL